MSRLIRQLLEQDDPLFTIHLSKLEKMAGSPGIDVRLTADILEMGRLKLSSLGLDPKDTTGAELYSALRAKIHEGDAAIHAYLGHPASSDEAAKKICTVIDKIVGKRGLWCVKPTVLKGILKKNPPKKVMKVFKFQSIDSMNKRMDMAEIIFAARMLESKTWWTKQKKLMESLGSKDFEESKLKVLYLSDVRWLPLISDWEANKGHGVITSIECGAVGFAMNGGEAQYITNLPLLLHACNEILLHGSYLKLHYVHPSVGMALVHAVDEGTMIHSTISGIAFHWRDIQRYFGEVARTGDVSYVHLDVQDLGWIHTEAKLALLIPELAFWVGCDFVGLAYGDGKIISLNIHDVARSVRGNLGFQDMFRNKMQRALRSELMARYMHIPITRALVIKQFDISTTSEENW